MALASALALARGVSERRDARGYALSAKRSRRTRTLLPPIRRATASQTTHRDVLSSLSLRLDVSGLHFSRKSLRCGDAGVRFLESVSVRSARIL